MTTPENNAEESLLKAIAAIKSEYGCTNDAARNDSENDKLCENEEKEKMANMIIKKFQASFDVPPIAEIEYLIHKPFTLTEVRIMLFSPLENQISYYVTILNETNSNNTSNDFIKVRNLILSLLFLIHRKVWSFMSDFILAGGLHAIAGYMASDNLYIRGQVLEIFLSATDCDTFDWFQPHDNDFRKSELHKAMLSLSSNKSFLQNLLSNRVSSYPGGSFRSLQILAFWLSWVRAMYTENQQLHLSKALFSELESWYVDTTLVIQDGMGGDGGPQSIEKPDEEVNLAKTLYEDFFNSQHQSESESEREQPTSAVVDSSDLFVTGFSTSSLASSQQAPIEEPSTLSIHSISTLKEKGNVEFRAKQYSKALTCYTNAIDDLLVLKDSSDLVAFPPSGTAGGGSQSSFDDDELAALEISLHMNAATALWHLATDAASTSIQQGEESVTALLERCAEHSRIVLKADPMQLKGLYRLVHVMLWQGNAVGALEVVTSALAAVNNSATTAETDTPAKNASSLKDLLGKLRLKCLAAIIVEDHSADNSADTVNAISDDSKAPSRATSLLPAKCLRVLNSILSRNQSKVRVKVPFSDAPGKSVVLKTSSSLPKSSVEGDVLQATAGVSKIQLKITKGSKSDGSKKCSTLPLPPKSDHHPTSAAVDASKEKSKSKPSVAVTAAFVRLKQLSLEYEKVKNRNNGAIVDPVLQAEQIKLLESSPEPLRVIQSEGISMKKLFQCSLEECYLLYLLSAGNRLSADHRTLVSQLFSELKDCERFQTVLTLSIMDDGKLKDNTVHTSQYLLSSDQNSLSTKIRKGLENFLQILSAN